MLRVWRLGAVAGMVGTVLLGGRLAAAGTAASGDLFFDTFHDSLSTPARDATVQKVHFAWDGAGSLVLVGQTTILDLGSSGNADGLIFAPDGTLLIGGSTSHLIERITTAGSVIGTISVGGTDPYHLSLSPDGRTLYSGGSTQYLFGTPVRGDNPGPLGVSPLFADGSAHTLAGSDTALTQIAFDRAGNAYYTSSQDSGTGNFGTINLSTFVTTRALSTLAGAHGITFDAFTGDLILSGSNKLVQINPATLAVVATVDLTSSGLSMLDQVTVDGQGHLFAGDNGNIQTNTPGSLVFIDYSRTGLINDPTSTLVHTPLALALDDLAPLSGPGSQVPEPSAFATLAAGLAALIARRRSNVRRVLRSRKAARRQP